MNAFRPAVFALGIFGVACESPRSSAVTDAGTVPPVQDSAVPAVVKPSEPTRLVLRAKRAIQPRTGARIEPAFVDVNGGKIVAVSSTAPLDGAAPIDLGEVSIIPGLIDAHTHLLNVETPDEGSMVAQAVMLSEADRALRGAHLGKQMLDAGFTTVRDLGNSGHAGDVALRNAIRKGWVEGPSMFVSTRALAPPGGQFPRLPGAHQALIEQEYMTVRSVDDARAHVRQAFYEGADCIKLIVDHGDGRTLTLDEVRAAVTIAHEASRKVAAHALTEKAAELAVAGGVDSIEHGYAISTTTLGEMGRRHLFLVPTDYPGDFYAMFAPNDDRRDATLEHFKSFRRGAIDRLTRAIKANVPIAFGSDAYVDTPAGDRGRDVKLVIRAYAEAGMTPLAILQSATSNAAELLGLSDKTGTLEVGSPADLIAVSGDPTADSAALSSVTFVMKRGKIVRHFRGSSETH